MEFVLVMKIIQTFNVKKHMINVKKIIVSELVIVL